MVYDVGTVFILIMENRSFDHMLGHLNASIPTVDGIRRDDPAWLDANANLYGGTAWRPFRGGRPEARIAADPPHDRERIKLQLGAGAPGTFAMNGFVESYSLAKENPLIDANHPPAVMGWFDAEHVPTLSFLASQFAVCNRWFAALPAGTQPNKMMAMGGRTLLDRNSAPLPNQRVVYDWLEERKVNWRVYHDGIPFFATMPRWSKHVVFDKRFRSLSKLRNDLANGDPTKFPQVVFIEPTYSSSPQFGQPNDDHAPGGVARGQEFLRGVYETITSVPAIWDRSLTIVTYDEHGGFFDHVPPPKVSTSAPPGGLYEPFTSLGVRVPAVVISPYVRKGTVHDGLLDHTSILKLLGSLFGGQYGYEEPINSRPVGNVLDVLNNAGGRTPPKLPSPGKVFLTAKSATPPSGRFPGTHPQDELEWAFQAALDEIRKGPPDPEGKFDDLLDAFPAETGGLA